MMRFSSDHRHYVGGYAHGHKVKHGIQFGLANAIALGKSLHELEAHTASRQVRAGIGAVLKLGVEYGNRIGELVVGHMMVADDEINTERLGITYFLDGFDAAIKDDYEFYALGGGVVYGP